MSRNTPAPKATINHVRSKAMEITGQRFCLSCNAMRKCEGGAFYTAGNHQRYWRCSVCLEFRKART